MVITEGLQYVKPDNILRARYNSETEPRVVELVVETARATSILCRYREDGHRRERIKFSPRTGKQTAKFKAKTNYWSIEEILRCPICKESYAIDTLMSWMVPVCTPRCDRIAAERMRGW